MDLTKILRGANQIAIEANFIKFPSADGEYPGLIKSAHLTERQSQYHANGVRQVLEIKVEVTREEDDPVTLLHSVNYTWSEKGRLLEKLGKPR